jgi:hypothetical protein
MRNNHFRPDHPTVEAAFLPHFHSDPIDRQLNGEEEANYRYGVY